MIASPPPPIPNLLVVDDAGALLGIVTENDFLRLARALLAE